MARRYTHKFTVEGSGNFPFDMLRYDRCWPSTQDDVTTMVPHNSEHFIPIRQVTLTASANHSIWEPTTGRWANFGWPVIEHTKETYDG